MDNIQYKYREDDLIKQLQEYVDTTYCSEDNSHYAQGDIEVTEYNIDQGHGDGFIAGNINKYNNRYGKKDGRNRKDLMKVLHYALMRLYLHDKETQADKLVDILKDWEPLKESLQSGYIPTPKAPYISDLPYDVTFNDEVTINAEEPYGTNKKESGREPNGLPDTKSYFTSRTVKGFGNPDK